MSSFRKALCAFALAITTIAGGSRCAADIRAVAIASPPSATTAVYATWDEPSGAVHPEIYADMSDSGRFVVYRSSARNVLPGVVSPVSADQIYLFDRLAGQTTLVSHGMGPSEFGNAESSDARVSGDGSTVLFRSRATNLGGPGTTHPGAYLFDRSSGALQFLGETDVPYWIPSEPLSHDGLWVALLGPAGLALHRKGFGAAHQIVLAQGCVAAGWEPHTLSADGRYLAFSQFCGVPFGEDTVLFDRESGIASVAVARAKSVGLSRDGRFALVWSKRSDLVDGQIDSGKWNLFRYDRVTGEVLLVSRGASAVEATEASQFGRISDDGRIVAFDRNHQLWDFDAVTATVRLLSVPGAPPMASHHLTLSGDGATVSYFSDRDIAVVDRVSGAVRIVTSTEFPGVRPNGDARLPRLSRDGSLVVFASEASNLGLGLRDYDAGPTLYGAELASDTVVALSLAGNPNRVLSVDPGIFLSANGERVAFAAEGNTVSRSPIPHASAGLTPFLLDRAAGRTDPIDLGMTYGGGLVGLSGNGSTALLGTGHEGEPADRLVMVRLASGQRWISPVGFLSGTASISDSGNVVAFSNGSVWVWEPESGGLVRVSRSGLTGGQENGASSEPVVSADGRFVAFTSLAGDLIGGAPFSPGSRNVFLYDRVEDSVRLVSSSGTPVPADGETWLSGSRPGSRVVNSDGRYLALTTRARNLGGLALPVGTHIVLYDRVVGSYTLVSGPVTADLPDARLPSLDASGRFVAFERHGASPGGPISASFLFDRLNGTAERLLEPSPGGSPHEENVLISGDASTITLSSRGEMPTGMAQAYVIDRRTRRLSLASHSAAPDVPGNDVSRPVALDTYGDAVLLLSSATNLGIDLGFTGGVSEVDRYAAFIYTPPPVVHGVSPSCASTTGGRTVTIEGAHFKPGSTVTLDGIPATVTNVTSTSITAITGARAPTAARTGNVEVRSPDGEYFALGNAFTYAVRGDANNSGALTAADAFYLKMALFLGGPQPATLCNGDANGSGATTSADAFFLNLYLFLGGAPPPA